MENPSVMENEEEDGNTFYATLTLKDRMARRNDWWLKKEIYYLRQGHGETSGDEFLKLIKNYRVNKQYVYIIPTRVIDSSFFDWISHLDNKNLLLNSIKEHFILGITNCFLNNFSLDMRTRNDTNIEIIFKKDNEECIIDFHVNVRKHLYKKDINFNDEFINFIKDYFTKLLNNVSSQYDRLKSMTIIDKSTYGEYQPTFDTLRSIQSRPSKLPPRLLQQMQQPTGETDIMINDKSSTPNFSSPVIKLSGENA